MLRKLFLTFAKIGLFTFGGGYGMIALVQDECVEKKKWITEDEFASVLAIAESTPGPIAINCATYTGYVKAGIAGSVAATFGVVMPSFVIIYLISMFFDNLLKYPIVSNAFRGIQIGVGILIFRAGYKMLRSMEKKIFQAAVFLSSFLLMLAINCFAWKISTVTLLLTAGILGLFYFRISIFSRNKNTAARKTCDSHNDGAGRGADSVPGSHAGDLESGGCRECCGNAARNIAPDGHNENPAQGAAPDSRKEVSP